MTPLGGHLIYLTKFATSTTWANFLSHIPFSAVEALSNWSVYFVQFVLGVKMESFFDFAYQITQAVSHLHKNGVLHRNISVRSCFLQRNRLILGEFQIAKRLTKDPLQVRFVGNLFLVRLIMCTALNHSRIELLMLVTHGVCIRRG